MVLGSKGDLKSIVHSFFTLTGVKYNSWYLKNKMATQPNYGSLLGLQDILTDYQVDNLSVRISADDFHNLDTPVIVQTATPNPQFVIVEKIDGDNISIINRRDEQSNLSFAEFLQTWTGVVILSNVDESSGEPDYSTNWKKGVIKTVKLPLMIFLLGITFFLFIRSNIVTLPLTVYIFNYLFLTTGLIVSFLLVRKSVVSKSSFIDRICNITTAGNCNVILEGPASKLLGVISWSEIGLIYYTASLISFSVFKNAFGILYLINALALPYTFWSIYYQWRIAKTWCVFCLIIQALFWMIFINGTLHLLNNGITVADFIGSYRVILVFAWVFVVVGLMTPLVSKSLEGVQIAQEWSKLKSDDKLFEISLHSEKYYIVEDINTQLYFGSTSARFVITIISNPFCDPCAEAHQDIAHLLKMFPQDIRVQIIHAYVGDEQKQYDAAIYLASIYLQNEMEKSMEIFEEWYRGGKEHPERFKVKYPVIATEQANMMVHFHQNWRIKEKIIHTPTILVNGFKFPNWYSLKDLKYFISK